MRAYLAIAGVLAAIPLFAALQETHDLQWAPKVGEKAKHKLQIDGTMDIPQMGPMDLHFEMITESTVKQVTDEKVVIGGKLVDMKVLVGGNDVMEMGGGGMTEEMKQETEQVFNRKHELTSKMSEEMSGGLRAMRLTQFGHPEKPVAIDETWTFEMKGDKASNAPAARSKYTFKGTEEVDGKKYLRVDYSFSELEGAKPMGAIGHFLLHPDTREIFRVNADVNDAQFNEMMPPTNVKLVYQQQ